ncbi:MAG: hypothetical protein WC178_04920 [Candidatus Paceibacterota bacterium]
MKKTTAIGTASIVILIILGLSFWTGIRFAYQDNLERGLQERTSGMEEIQNMTNKDGEIKYRTVKLFYYDYSKGECIGYSYQPEDITEQERAVSKGLAPVERKIADSDNVIEDTVRLFLEGKITDKEKASGVYNKVYEEEYPLPGVELIEFDLSADGILSLTFADPKEKTRGVYCVVEVKKQQLEATAMQFSEVKSVKILPEGEIFAINDF